MATRYELFKQRWRACTACALCQGRQQVVLSAGGERWAGYFASIPCDLLFLGEAPGESEDCLGVPFVGPAGQLLDQIIRRALAPWQDEGGRQPIRCAFTNLVSCIPHDPEDGKKLAEPPPEAVEACQYRLQEFVEIADPQLLVCVGKLPWGWTEPGYRDSLHFHKELPRITFKHPAAILRENIAQRGLSVQRCVVTLRRAVEELLGR